MLPFQPNVENIFHARLPVDSSNCFSTSSSDSVSILSASDSAWAAPSLQMAFVCIEMPGCGGSASSSSSDRQDIGNRLTSQLNLDRRIKRICVSVIYLFRHAPRGEPSSSPRQVNRCDLDSARLKMRADRAAQPRLGLKRALFK